MKKIFYFVFAAMLCCGFVACSDSDEKESGGSGSEELLLGTWHLVKYYGIEDNEWYYSDDDEYDDGNFMTFLPNGGGYYGLWEEFMFEWQLVGSNLYFREEDGDKWDAKIVKLTQRELVLDDGWDCEYYERY